MFYIYNSYLIEKIQKGNRKNKIKLARLEVEEAKSMAEFQKEEIRKAVIIMYQDLILKQKLLQIRSRRLGDGKVNMQMIEKEGEDYFVHKTFVSDFPKYSFSYLCKSSNYEYLLIKTQLLPALLRTSTLYNIVFESYGSKKYEGTPTFFF